MKQHRRQRGYLLITVLVALSLLATVAVLLNHDSAINANTSSKELETARAEYVAQAGMQHALWRATNNACMGDVTIPATTLGSDSYAATITGAAAGTAYTLTADQDAWIRSDDVSRNNGTTAWNHIKQQTGNVEQVLTRFDLSPLPADAQINSAIAWFHLKAGKEHPEGMITVHEITANWAETAVTWESLNGAYRSGEVSVIPAQDSGDVWVALNISGLVQAWVNGQANNGILFHTPAEGIHTEYTARENGANPPRLEVVVGSGPASPVTIQATGTLANGVTRTLSRPLNAAYQPPVIHTFRPGPAGSEDAEIWDQSPNNNYGDADETWVSSASNDTTRTLLRFDIGAIPVGARILAASLSLHRQSGSGADQPVSVHRLVNPWSEDTVTWNSREGGTNWDTAGGDFDRVAVATTPVGPVNQRYEWDIASLVQGWVDDSYPNYGVAMIAAIDGMNGERFYTSDQAVFDTRPSLSVSYACECNNPCMAPRSTGNLLMVTGNSPANPTASDDFLRNRFERWGYSVTFIQDDDSSSNFDSSIAANDVVFVSASVAENNVGTKLTNAAIGVVNQEGPLNDELGIATGNAAAVGDAIDVSDTNHYITSVFRAGTLPVYDDSMELLTASGTEAQQQLADLGGTGTLIAVDQGTPLPAGGTAAGQRVMVPLGQQSTVNLTRLNNNGWLVLHRSLDWAMGAAVSSTGSLLLVVGNASTLTNQETQKKALIESWGFTVNLIDEDDSQGDFNTAFNNNHVVFVGEDVNASDVGNKLTGASIGVVIEEANLADDLGLSDNINWDSGTTIFIDNGHYITAPLLAGDVTLLTTSESLANLEGNLAPDLQVIGGSFFDGLRIVALDAGGQIVGGGVAAGRRVFLPWGGNNMDVNHLNDDGLLIFRRSLEWAAGIGSELPPNIVLTTEGTATLGGLTFTDKDLAEYNPSSDTSTLFFDGAAAGLSQDIDAFHHLENGRYVLSTINTTTFGDLTFENEDLVVYDPSTGNASLLFDGSELFTSGSTDISAVHVTSDGHYLLTNEYSATLGGLSFTPSDIVDYDPANDTATTLLDGSTVGLTGWINAVHLLDTSNIVLSVDGSATLGGLSFGEGDLVEYDIAADTATLFFDGALFSSAENVRAVHVGDGINAVAGSTPIAHWKLDETSGTIAVDSVGGHDGTLNNGPAWSPGTLEGALSFDGIDDYVDLTSDAELDDVFVGGATIMAWIEPIGWGENGYGRVFDKSSSPSSTGDGWVIRMNKDNGGIINFGQGFTGGRGWWAIPNGSITLNTWQHIAVAYDASSTASDPIIYLDGSPLSVSEKDTPSGDVRSDASINLRLGNFAGDTTHTFAGKIDDARIYDRMLDAAEIAEIVGGADDGGGDGGGSCEGTFRDEFNAVSYGNNDGTMKFSTEWIEINENDGPDSGDERVVNTDSNYHLQVRDNDGSGEGVQREADLSTYLKAALSFEYRRDGFDNSNDYVMLQVSDSGASKWDQIDQITGPGTDKSYVPKSYDISAYISATTRFRFLTSANLGSGDELYVDNVQIAVKGCR